MFIPQTAKDENNILSRPRCGNSKKKKKREMNRKTPPILHCDRVVLLAPCIDVITYSRITLTAACFKGCMSGIKINIPLLPLSWLFFLYSAQSFPCSQVAYLLDQKCRATH